MIRACFLFFLLCCFWSNLTLASARLPARMPSFEVQTVDGSKMELSAEKMTKPALIVFWATWCRSCQHEIPLLKKFFQEHGKEVDLLAISVDQDRKKLKDFVKNAQIEYPVFIDEKGKVADLFGITATPMFFAINSKGQICERGENLKTLIPALIKLKEANDNKSASGVQSITRDAVLMGTNISLVVLSEDEKKANQAIDEALNELKRIDDLMTDWRASELMQVNHQAGKKPAKLGFETIALLQQAKKASELTNGAFDITSAVAGVLWDYTKPSPRPPNDADVKKALALIGHQDLEIDSKKMTAFLNKPGMRIWLGGIAKGYAVDRAADVLKKWGMKDFALKAGGDLVTHGKNQDRLWNVMIQDPVDKTKNFAVIPISNGAVSTSGNNERFFMHNGKRYGHIIDPRTGYPADKCESVTIIAKRSYWADALSTGVFVLGPDEGMALIEKLDDVEGVIVDAKGKVHVSSGLQAPLSKRLTSNGS